MDANELLVAAFQSDPFMTWAEPNPERRPRTLARVFGGLTAYAQRWGGMLHEPGVGVVQWRDGSAAEMGRLAVATSGLWKVATAAPPAVWLRLSAHESAAMEGVRPHLTPGSVYLSTLGVHPRMAGKGHGSKLLQRALRQQASRWSTCVLRTEQPRNVAFYQRSGFTMVDEFVVGVSHLRVWVFSRSTGG